MYDTLPRLGVATLSEFLQTERAKMRMSTTTSQWSGSLVEKKQRKSSGGRRWNSPREAQWAPAAHRSFHFSKIIIVVFSSRASAPMLLIHIQCCSFLCRCLCLCPFLCVSLYVLLDTDVHECPSAFFRTRESRKTLSLFSWFEPACALLLCDQSRSEKNHVTRDDGGAKHALWRCLWPIRSLLLEALCRALSVGLTEAKNMAQVSVVIFPGTPMLALITEIHPPPSFTAVAGGRGQITKSGCAIVAGARCLFRFKNLEKLGMVDPQ